MNSKKLVTLLALLVALFLSACGGSDADATPTVSVELIQTQAVLTYQAQLTQTALANPTSTSTLTESPTPAATFSAPTISSPIAIATTPTIIGGGSSACYGLSYVSDVTIPDGTQVTPGQSFTKTWRVSNTGTCAWEAGFTFNVVSGDAMGGTAVTLNQRVEAGRQYEFSVPMVAPTNKTGTLTGYWQLSDANGSFFGDQVYVEVDVSGGGSAPTSTTTAEATATTAPAATETATP
jgi:Ig-like domain from next to BRCA1 gene